MTEEHTEPVLPTFSADVSLAAPSCLQEVMRGSVSTLPILIGVIPLGIIFGAQAVQAGFEPFSAIILPGLNFAGGSEFAAIPLWSTVPPILLIMLTTFLINSRHIVMGAALAPYLKGQPALRIALIYFLMCDETWALNLQEMARLKEQGKRNVLLNVPFYFGVGCTFWTTWVITCGMGAFLGTVSGDLSEYGFNMAMPATFIALCAAMWPVKKTQQVKDWTKLWPVAAAAVVSALAGLSLGNAYSVGLGVLTGIITAFVQSVYRERGHKQTAVAKQGGK